MLFDFGLYYKTALIRTVQWLCKTDTGQYSRIDSPDISPHTYDQLIYNKGGKAIQCIKGSLFNK